MGSEQVKGGGKMNSFRQNVLEGKYKEAYEIAQTMKPKDICDELIAISFDTKNMLAYGFVVFALLRKETPRYHGIAKTILLTSYVDIPDAGELALCHVRKALEIDENSIEALLDLMECAEHPDTSATKEDYAWAKAKIAKLYPNDVILECEYGKKRITPEMLKTSKALRDANN